MKHLVLTTLVIATSLTPALASDIDYSCSDGSTARATDTGDFIVQYPSNLMISIPLSADLKGKKLYGNMKTISNGCTPDSAAPICAAVYFDETAQTPRALFVLQSVLIQCSGEPYFVEDEGDGN